LRKNCLQRTVYSEIASSRPLAAAAFAIPDDNVHSHANIVCVFVG
jgi:hypothetical protein